MFLLCSRPQKGCTTLGWYHFLTLSQAGPAWASASAPANKIGTLRIKPLLQKPEAPQWRAGDASVGCVFAHTWPWLRALLPSCCSREPRRRLLRCTSRRDRSRSLTLGGGDRSKFQAAFTPACWVWTSRSPSFLVATEDLQAVPSFEAAFWRRPTICILGRGHQVDLARSRARTDAALKGCANARLRERQDVRAAPRVALPREARAAGYECGLGWQVCWQSNDPKLLKVAVGVPRRC